MAYAKKWATIISYIAGRIYFSLIIFQVPLFRVPCRAGICTTPLEVISSHLIATEVWPAAAGDALLYPGAAVNAILKNKTIPSFSNLLLNAYPNFKRLKDFDHAATTDLQHIEVLVGSYLSVAGALLVSLRPGRMSLAGNLLVLWGLAKELYFGTHALRYPREVLSLYPTMLIASTLAFFSIKTDVRKLIRSFKPRRHSKSKYI